VTPNATLKNSVLTTPSSLIHTTHIRGNQMTLSARVTNVLQDIGLKGDDVVFVHSGASALAELADSAVTKEECTRALHDGLISVLGTKGTIAAPAFFYDYARFNTPFDLETSPPDAALGRYPRFLFTQLGVKRSLNPLMSVQALGPDADFICEHRSAYGYGPASPWARLTDLDAYCLLFGAPFGATTFNHHVEAIVGVPHLYNKIYRTPAFAGGKPYDRVIVTGVRYLKYGVVPFMDRQEAKMEQRGLIKTIRKGRLNIQLFRLRDCEAVLADELSRDPYFLLERPPIFVAGEIPDDGATGPAPSMVPHE
jgi:aminoglycoside 3-N-acetyltransferase